MPRHKKKWRVILVYSAYEVAMGIMWPQSYVTSTPLHSILIIRAPSLRSAFQIRFRSALHYSNHAPASSILNVQLPLNTLNSTISDFAVARSMSFVPLDRACRICPPCDEEYVDHIDRIPDSLLLLVFNRIGDVKALGRCCVVSRRFHDLVPQVDNVIVKVDCVISDDESSAAAGSVDKSRASAFSSMIQLVFGGIVKPLQALGQLLGPKRSALAVGIDDDCEVEQGGVTHHSPTQVLRNFSELRSLKIELPTGELGIDDGVLLKWRADFGSTLDKCVILGASSIAYPAAVKGTSLVGAHEFGVTSVGDDNGSIPETFYTNGGLKLRVVWTISSLIAASARHYLLQPIIAEHHMLDSLVLTDADGQGVLGMNKGQLEELRVKPLAASSASKRTLVPALNMRLWYAANLELPNGVVLKGATLVAIRPSEQTPIKKDSCDLSWVENTFEEPYGTAVRMLMQRRTYCLEMNSF